MKQPKQTRRAKATTPAEGYVSRAPTEADIAFGHTIRKERMAQDMTLAELAAALGLSHQQLQKYETGTNRVSAGMVLKIAEALNLTLDELFAASRVAPRTTSPALAKCVRLLGQFDDTELSRAYSVLCALKT
ncbi:helix-turn-helix domain-containing protein [Hyphomonas sp. BRH_c22]|uniref:helix-turn-helix domain-containing protein n=1 Tax=Hyphomonas sp. BRH_c22 TaxID=1629710 RepID=UPI000AABE448|nr:helix-turn-helix domain-containing protein [Hyphomonas sp. BRH_c22]